jgi:hypothetical protein
VKNEICEFHVAMFGYTRKKCKILVNKPEEEDHLENVSIDGKMLNALQK